LHSTSVGGSWRDIFIFDGVIGQTAQLTAGNENSGWPSLSGDGQFVAFESFADDLTGAADNNFSKDIFVLNRVTGVTSRVSVSSDGTEGDNDSSSPAISADRRFVVFVSRATNLDPLDQNLLQDIFVHDRLSGTTALVSKDTLGIQLPGPSFRPAISANGRYIAFDTLSAGRNRVVLYDRQTGDLSTVSLTPLGFVPDGDSFGPSVSAKGRYVAFKSFGTNLVDGDTNGHPDVFVRDRSTGSNIRASMGVSEQQPNGPTDDPAISTDGRYVAFAGTATNLVPDDTNAKSDVFIRDLASNQTSRVSMTETGSQANGDSFNPTIARYGGFVSFESDATNIVSGDSNNTRDVFRAELPLQPGPPSFDSYVAMGDSFASGDGVPPYDPLTDTDQNRCHRSFLAYPNLVRSPDSPAPLSVRALQEPGIEYRSLACSGATTENVPPGGPSQYNEGGSQLDQGFVTDETDVVTITIGGNDAEFAPTLELCGAVDCLDPDLLVEGRPFSEWLIDKIDSLVTRLTTTYSAVRNAGPATLLAVGYPRLFSDTVAEQSCFKLHIPFVIDYSIEEQNYLNDRAFQLSGVLASGASGAGVPYVGLISAFTNHEVCADGGEWIKGPSLSGGSFHPNELGQQAYAEVVNSTLSPEAGALSGGPEEPRDSIAAPDVPGSLGFLSLASSPDGLGCDAPVFAPSDDVIVSGDGFRPGESVLVELRAAGQEQALLTQSHTVNGAGQLQFRLGAPDTLGIDRSYLLTARGLADDGGELLLVKSFLVSDGCDAATAILGDR
jgi:Tol biopolymer transport system component/lysophospholipase L1-like esterase